MQRTFPNQVITRQIVLFFLNITTSYFPLHPFFLLSYLSIPFPITSSSPKTHSTTTMPLHLLPATLSDIPTLTNIHLSAFMLVRINQALYPKGLTQPILTATESRHRTTFLHDPTARYIKIIDTDRNNKTIAFAEFHLFLTPEEEASRQDLKPKTWPEDTNLALATEYWGHIVAARRRMEGVPHVFLGIIATEPGEGRRGAGKMLMRWGVERADEVGMEMFLEASPMGVGLYRGFGFEEAGKFEVGIGEGERYVHKVMVRPGKWRRRVEVNGELGKD
jgi:GNAT superfamily N-acetyltransferase